MSKLYTDGIVFASAFSPSGAQPLDNRTVVQSFSDLLEIDGNVTFGDTKYNGMLVSVIEDQQTYMLIDSENSNLESAWKKIGSDESPIVMGDMPNSAVLKGGNNQVISEGGVSLGKDNVVGLKGWYYGVIKKHIGDNQITVYLSKTQKVLPLYDEPLLDSSADIVPDETLPNLYSLLGYGAKVSLVNDSKYDNAFIVIGGGNGYVQLSTVDSHDIPFTSIKHEALNDPEDYSIYCLSKPDAGIVDIGQFSFAAGYYNEATNGKSTAFGFNNHAYGKFSFAEGRDNTAGYAAHAEGRENVASGEQSHVEGKYNKALGNNSHVEGNSNIANDYSAHAEGYGSVVSSDINHLPVINESATNAAYSHAEGNGTVVRNHSSHAEGRGTIVLGNSAHAEGLKTQANANASHAEGNKTISNGSSSHAEGLQTITNNIAEHASGKYNKSIQSDNASQATHFSIGIGTSDTKRKNAFEVKQNGDVYITGLGGFKGDNSEDSKNLVEVINNLDKEIDNRISEIVDSAPETFDTLKEIADYIALDGSAASVATTLSEHSKNIENIQLLIRPTEEQIDNDVEEVWNEINI